MPIAAANVVPVMPSVCHHRAVAEAVLQLLMEADAEGLIGASRYERSGERTTWRNGCRERALHTRLGQLQLRIPKLRRGSWLRRRSAKPTFSPIAPKHAT